VRLFTFFDVSVCAIFCNLHCTFSPVSPSWVTSALSCCSHHISSLLSFPFPFAKLAKPFVCWVFFGFPLSPLSLRPSSTGYSSALPPFPLSPDPSFTGYSSAFPPFPPFHYHQSLRLLGILRCFHLLPLTFLITVHDSHLTRLTFGVLFKLSSPLSSLTPALRYLQHISFTLALLAFSFSSFSFTHTPTSTLLTMTCL
jgi:hypothetical protein